MTGAPPPPSTGQPEETAEAPSGSLRGAFTLEGRPAPGLYLLAWLLSGAGVALVFLGTQTGPPARGLLLMAGLLMLTAGLGAAAGYQVLARRDRPDWAYHGPSPLLVFAAFFVAVNAFAIALRIVLLAFGLEVDSPVAIALALAVQVGGYLAFVWLLVVRTGGLSWREMDLDRPWTRQRLVADILVGAGVMVPATFVILLATVLVFTLLEVRPPDVVPTPEEPLSLLLIALAAILLVPIGEEVFFRGFALTAWLRDLGERAAITRSALFFALFHIINITATTFDEGARQALGVVLIILPVGVVLGVLFTRRGLLAAISAHATYNGIGYLGRIASESLPPPT